MTRLRNCFPSDLGVIRRKKKGGGYTFIDSRGRPVRSKELLERVDGLPIPPAWREVWICPWPNGHIQAVGTDRAGRRQYLYHPAWREQKDEEKFDRMLELARGLPDLRRRIAADLDATGLTRPRVLACAAALLDRGLFRIGSEVYAEENGTFGLATLRKEHVRLHRDGSMSFCYLAKGSQERTLTLSDPDIAPTIAALRRRRSGGDELLAYREGREWRDVRSPEINAYLKESLGERATAKDFRTWHATVLAALALALSARESRPRPASKRAVVRAVSEVARSLGDTPAVARRSYIDPRVIDGYLAGRTMEPPSGVLPDGGMTTTGPARAKLEAAVIRLLEDRRGT